MKRSGRREALKRASRKAAGKIIDNCQDIFRPADKKRRDHLQLIPGDLELPNF
jgi:hypothetical protein